MLSTGLKILGENGPWVLTPSHSFHVFLILGDMGSQGAKGKQNLENFTLNISEG